MTLPASFSGTYGAQVRVVGETEVTVWVEAPGAGAAYCEEVVALALDPTAQPGDAVRVVVVDGTITEVLPGKHSLGSPIDQSTAWSHITALFNPARKEA